MAGSETPLAGVAFDVFGTLIGYGGRRTNPYRHLAAASAGDQQRRHPFLTRNTPIATFAAELGALHLMPVISRDLAVELAGLRVFDDVGPCVEILRGAGIRIALCSNLAYEYGAPVRRLLPGLDAYLFSYEVGAAKPDVRIYQAVCDRLGLTPKELLFIGDSQRKDVEGPRAFDMHARRIDRKVGQGLADMVEGLFTVP